MTTHGVEQDCTRQTVILALNLGLEPHNEIHGLHEHLSWMPVTSKNALSCHSVECFYVSTPTSLACPSDTKCNVFTNEFLNHLNRSQIYRLLSLTYRLHLMPRRRRRASLSLFVAGYHRSFHRPPNTISLMRFDANHISSCCGCLRLAASSRAVAEPNMQDLAHVARHRFNFKSKLFYLGIENVILVRV